MKKSVFVAFAFTLSATAHAQQIAPGEYLDGSGGFLLVKPGTGGNLPFEIRTFGGNRHVCSADGVIGKNRQAVLKTDGGGTCTLAFAVKGETIDVSVKGACSEFCGARASLDGLFHKPQPGCERPALRKTRAEFKRLYDRKAYADARAALEPLITRCAKTLDVDEDGWIRNDLALAQLRAGDAGACRKTLEPLAELARKSDAEVKEDYPPMEAERMVPIARAARTNLKLCQGK